MKERMAGIRRRMRSDFRLGLYVVFAIVAIVMLAPLGALRLYQGAYVHGVLNVGFVVLILGVAAHALRGGNLDRLGIALSLSLLGGGCAVAAIAPYGLFWLYPILISSAFMVGTRIGIGLFIAVVLFLLIEGDALSRVSQPSTVIGSIIATGAFSISFARFAAQFRAQLEQMAAIDPLTGVENRRALELGLEVAIAGFRRDGRPVALALLDLDHFKSVNDRFGHEVGDDVLQAFARLVQGAVRRTDRLFRYGGEEFVLLMPGTDELGLELAMGHLHAQVRDGLSAGGEAVTVSIGGAVLRMGEDRDAWFCRADDALYRAKQGGRNRLEIDRDA